MSWKFDEFSILRDEALVAKNLKKERKRECWTKAAPAKTDLSWNENPNSFEKAEAGIQIFPNKNN